MRKKKKAEEYGSRSGQSLLDKYSRGREKMTFVIWHCKDAFESEKLVLMVYVESTRLHTTKMDTSVVSVIKALWNIKRNPFRLTCPAIERIGKGRVQ